LGHDLDQAFALLKRKEQDYTAYKFNNKEAMAIFAFFDLAQEFATVSNLYRIAVAVINFFFQYESCIYTIRPEDEALMLQCCTREGLLETPLPARPEVVVHHSPYRAGSSYLFPIIGKKALTDKVPLFMDNQILGMFEIYPVKRMSKHAHLFFQKYTNRVGYNMHNKLVVQQSTEHIQFINQLVSDIEHNVITPNLYYKAFLINMKKDLSKLQPELESVTLIPRHANENTAFSDKEGFMRAVDNLHGIHQDMERKMAEFETHFNHLSLFIETLFRGEHFKTGSYVLKRRSYNVLKDIFFQELKHYRKRLTDRGIDIIEPLQVPADDDLTLFIDLGLTAQVFANLFSNALKYCRPAPDDHGSCRKHVSYCFEVVDWESYEIRKALKISLFSSGKPIAPKETILIFEDGYKIAGDDNKGGSGHGLHFVKNIVELHGGQAGCTPRDNGNDFYIIFPKIPKKKPGRHADL
jgi:signal transduction histidine kinase